MIIIDSSTFVCVNLIQLQPTAVCIIILHSSSTETSSCFFSEDFLPRSATGASQRSSDSSIHGYEGGLCGECWLESLVWTRGREHKRKIGQFRSVGGIGWVVRQIDYFLFEHVDSLLGLKPNQKQNFTFLNGFVG